MAKEKEVHVLGLNPREQLTLRYLLGNLMSGFLDKTVSESMSSGNQQEVDAKASHTLLLFNRYNDFIDMLCSEDNLGRAKSKVLLISPTMMRYIVLSVSGYDPKNSYLGVLHKRSVDLNFNELKQKVLETAKYTFSDKEIESAKNS